MSQVRKNTLANYAGQAWTALMGVIFVPVYVRYVGIEAYGIIGFFVAIQQLLSILDFGVSATLNRELAQRSGAAEAVKETRDLVRTLEWICWPTGAAMVLVVWGLSAPAAEQWLRPDSFTIERTAHALVLLGVAFALQWPCSFYTGGLAGLQRQVLLNALTAGFATVRAGGAMLVLAFLSPTLEAFLWWQIAASAVQTTAFSIAMWSALPPSRRRASFSSGELRRVGRFALGIIGITVLSFFLGNADRIVLSKILSLYEFGIYAFASSVAFALMRLIHPIVMAVYPRYSQLAAAANDATLADFYHRSNQLICVAVLPVAATIAVFAQDLLRLWTSDAVLSAAAAPILALLILGTAANGLMNLPYSLQLAHGWTSLAFWINAASVCVLLPATWILGREFGGIGTASVWLALNLSYLAIGIPLMHRRLLRDEMRRWYLMDIGPPIVASAVAVLLWKVLMPSLPPGILGWAVLAAVLATAMMTCAVVTPVTREVVLAWWRRRFGHA